MNFVSLCRAGITLILGVIVERPPVISDLHQTVFALDYTDQAFVYILDLDRFFHGNEGRPDFGTGLIARALPTFILLKDIERPAGAVGQVLAKGLLSVHC